MRIHLRKSREAGYLPPVIETRYSTTFGELLFTQVFTWSDMEYVVTEVPGVARDIKSEGLRVFKPSTPVHIVTKTKS